MEWAVVVGVGTVARETPSEFFVHLEWPGSRCQGRPIEDLLSEFVRSVVRRENVLSYSDWALSTVSGACKKNAGTLVVEIMNLGDVSAKEFSISRTAYSERTSNFRALVCLCRVFVYVQASEGEFPALSRTWRCSERRIRRERVGGVR